MHIHIALFIMIFHMFFLLQEIHASCSPHILINKLAGTVKLDHVIAYLKWSKIGNLHMHLVQVHSFVS